MRELLFLCWKPGQVLVNLTWYQTINASNEQKMNNMSVGKDIQKRESLSLVFNTKRFEKQQLVSYKQRSIFKVNAR